MDGDITGVDGEGMVSKASILLGTSVFELQLSGSDTRQGVARKWEQILRNAGFDATYSAEFKALFVVVLSGRHGVGAGCSDVGIEISATTMVTR